MLGMNDLAVKIIKAGKLWRIPLLVVIVAGAIKDKLAADCDHLAGVAMPGGYQPLFVRVGPVGGHYFMFVANVFLDVIFRGRFTDIIENLVPVRDG